MTTAAIIMMVGANAIVIGITAYFFIRILRTDPPDSVDEDVANYPRGG